MRAIQLKMPGGTDQLEQIEMDKPVAAPGEVLVQVKAISINPVDVKTRLGKGMYGRLKEFTPLILGWDISGIVAETGAGVTEFKTGDEVFGMVRFPGHGQAYAEYVSAPAHQLALKPSRLSHAEAAAATLAALTAWQALTQKTALQPGQRVLIHAAAGGVGHYAVQIAKTLGCYVLGTASAHNKEFVLELGADEFIDYKKAPFETQVANIDFVLDTIGGENIDRSLEIIKPGGTIISIPSGLNDTVVDKAKAKNITGLFFLVQSSGDDMQRLAELLQQGKIRSFVSQTFQFDELPAAHKQVESASTKGKVVVLV